jgi:hypothetical protein
VTHQLHLRRTDLLAEELWCSSDHEARDAHGEQREHEDAVQAAAVAAGAYLAEQAGAALGNARRVR